jgi:hypothetical protein
MTTQTLDQYQKIFANKLLTERLTFTDSEGLLEYFIPIFEGDGSDASQEAMDRMSIYRNNVILSLSTAIADTFPVVKRLIGDECFQAAAVAFVREQPPSQPSLLYYGENFIDYIKTYPACIELDYISDVAQLEWYYIRAFHAEESDLLDNQELQQILPESLADAVFKIHPSVRLMQSDWPVDYIWEENLKQDVETIDLNSHAGCKLLLYRDQLQVQVVNLAPECFDFLTGLNDGKSINNAWSYTVDKQRRDNQNEIDESELSGMLGYLLSLPLFTEIND